MIDIPDEVRSKVKAEGHAEWLEEVVSTVAVLADQWSLTVGNTLRGGHAALVLAVQIADGTPAVLKIGVPGTAGDVAREAVVLQLVDGEGCARLLGEDPAQNAILLERLGAPMSDVVPDVATRHDLLCDLAVDMWRPLDPAIALPTGADVAHEFAELLPRLWEATGRPCASATVHDAIACAARRSDAHDDERSVLVHGDIHDANALDVGGGKFRLIDPKGIRAERACDLGTILRCDPGAGADLRARTVRLADRTGVDASAIWEWGTIYRVTTGLYCRSIGIQPFGDLLLAEADRVAGDAHSLHGRLNLESQ